MTALEELADFENQMKHTLEVARSLNCFHFVTPINEATQIAKTMMNDALSIIEEISKWNGAITTTVPNGYLREKVLALVGDYNAMIHDYNVIFDNKYREISSGFFAERQTLKEMGYSPEQIAKILEENRKDVLGDYDVLNGVWTAKQ